MNPYRLPVADPTSPPRCAVLGHPIEHSLSPLLHTAGYRALGLKEFSYARIDCPAGKLSEVVGERAVTHRGFSVTMPGKFEALAFADEATARARAIGAANTLVRQGDRWVADNTDCDGVAGALTAVAIQEQDVNGSGTAGRRAVIIGAGGTARPALWALAGVGITEITIVNRSDRQSEFASLMEALPGVAVDFVAVDLAAAAGGHHASRDLDAVITGAAVVVSTVPSVAIAGCEHRIACAPVVDVIYHPWPTPLVTAARAAGYPAVGGHEMLLCQAFGQFECFTGHPAPTAAMRGALWEHLGTRP